MKQNSNKIKFSDEEFEAALDKCKTLGLLEETTMDDGERAFSPTPLTKELLDQLRKTNK
jgi:hypothetical protein